MNHLWIFSGAISALLSVVSGAFGSHSLAETLSPRALSIWQTAAQYQMYHALGLVGLGAWAATSKTISETGLATATGTAFLIGTLLFSGSLYALALTDIKILGAVTPLGGLAFMVGWICLAVLAFKS